MDANNRTLILESNADVYSIIKKIVEKPNQDEPFYICDVSKLIWNIKNWKKLMPRVNIFYAVKCNESRVVLETFAALGIGFDCASKEEIRKIVALGVPPQKIIFSNPTKLVSHLTYATEMGVTIMTFDNEAELYKIQRHCPNAELLLRIRCDDPSARYALGKKFGALPDQEATDLLQLAKLLELNVIGIHFHVGSGSENHMAYYNAISTAKKVFDVGAKLGYQFRLLDIGGGYPGESFKPLDKIGESVNKAIEEHFPDEAVQIVAEPGKYCCNTPFKLVTQINSKKIVTDGNNQKVRMYYVDVSTYVSLLCVLFQEYYICRPVNNERTTEDFPSIIWGPTQETRDRISEKFDYLPELKIGDWILFEEAGGYSLSITCEYNGVASPGLYAVVKKDDWLMLTENVPKPLSKDRFTTSLDDFLKDRNEPYVFRKTYF